jgi:hypothetical protein
MDQWNTSVSVMMPMVFGVIHDQYCTILSSGILCDLIFLPSSKLKICRDCAARAAMVLPS